MSAMLLSQKHYACILDTLKYKGLGQYHDQLFAEHKIKKEHLNFEIWVRLLYQANLETYDLKYGHLEEDPDFPTRRTSAPPYYKVKFPKGEILSRPGMLKALACVQYQIELYQYPEKGNCEVPKEIQKAVDNLESLINELSYSIASEHPEYVKTKWSIE